MYSISTRLNQVFFFGVMCVAVLCIFNIATTLFINSKPDIKVFEITEISHIYKNPFSKAQHASGKFNLDMDITPIMNWNTNLIFVWITAHYKTGKEDVDTTSTIYDIIILRSEPEKWQIKLENVNFYYPIVDNFDTLNGKSITYVLNWEQAPVVGPILKKKVELGTFQLPDSNPKLPSKREILREYDYEVYHLKDD